MGLKKHQRIRYKGTRSVGKTLRYEPNNSPTKRKHLYWPGTVALREIRRYQKSTELLIQKSPFLCGILNKAYVNPQIMEICIGLQALMTLLDFQVLMALQEASEAFLIRFFKTHIYVPYSQRVKLMPKDMRLARRIRGERVS